MPRRDDSLQARLDRDLAELKLLEITRAYHAVLDEVARKGSSMLEVLAQLVSLEAASRQQRALGRRLAQVRLPKRKTLEEMFSTSPSGFPRRRSCGCSTAASSSGTAVRS
jgi:DNA replication protein DnaC